MNLPIALPTNTPEFRLQRLRSAVRVHLAIVKGLPLIDIIAVATDGNYYITTIPHEKPTQQAQPAN